MPAHSVINYHNTSKLYTVLCACGHRFTSVISKAVKIGTGKGAERPHDIGDKTDS